MSQENLANLQAALALKQRELDLVLAIDHIRDTAPDPAAMLSAIVGALADHLVVDLCLIALVDRETGQLELKAIHDRSQQQGKLELLLTRNLVQEVINLNGIVIWSDARLAQQIGNPTSIPEELQVAAVPIITHAGERLGGLLLARIGSPFGSSDIKLLETAESMVDSAVIQGYAHTVIGQAANLGARLCSAAKGGEVLICPQTYELVRDQVEAAPVTGLQFKGISRNLIAYQVKQVLV